MKNFKLYFFFILFSLFVVSCSEDEKPFDPTAGLVKITEGVIEDAEVKVELWAKEALFAGYNPVFFALYDVNTNERITDAHIHLHPMMYMTSGMNHSCPVEEPESEEAVNELFPAALVFVMPTSDMGYWKLEVSVHNHLNNLTGETDLDIAVENPPTPRIISFTTASSEKYFISYMFPEMPKVGINDFVVMAHERVSEMEWSAEEEFTFVLTPEMPSMGHGSPNNVNPVHQANGHYAGKVNFTMTGEWRLNLEIRKAGELLQEMYFDVTIE
jgi:hypothetical protein